MSSSPSKPKGPNKLPANERRTTAKGPAGTLRRLKGALGRPLGLERRGAQLHVVLVERRRPQQGDLPLPLMQLRAELRARLLIQEQEHGEAANVMRHLAFVHDELGRKGWAGVGALPAPVLVKALAQAELLAAEEPSQSLQEVIERLRALHVDADLRDERESQMAEFDSGDRVEVSESNFAEYEEMERSWVGTMPSQLGKPERDE